MGAQTEIIAAGGITNPSGFLAGAVYSGIKKETSDVLDLAVLFSEVSCTVAGLFTTNKVQAAPVLLDKVKLQLTGGKTRALIVNSGCANACTGEQGMRNAIAMADIAAKKLQVNSDEVLIASTGVIGVQLPMDKIESGLTKLVFGPGGGHDFSRAIMTTDTGPKEIAIRVKSEQAEYVIGGTVKGAGMIHPNMATMLCFITTDAAIERSTLQLCLNQAVDSSFNMITIDGDTSTNDTVLLLANGLARNSVISAGSQMEEDFREALTQVCIYLARSIAQNGEGATRLIEVVVNGAASPGDARLAARTIAGSSLVKAAVHGRDPNWGRIVAAAGRSGAAMQSDHTDIYIGNLCLFKGGTPLNFSKKDAKDILNNGEVQIRLELNLGKASATAWGCDLSEEYVVINSEYTT